MKSALQIKSITLLLKDMKGVTCNDNVSSLEPLVSFRVLFWFNF